MIKLEDSRAQGLIDKLIEEFQEINLNRKAHNLNEFSIGEIVAPLYYYLGDEKRCVSFKNLLDDLEMYPNYTVTLFDYDVLSEESPGMLTLRIELYRFTYLDDRIMSPKADHYYEITFFNLRYVTITTGDVVRRWDFRLEETTRLEEGYWESETLDSTANCSYDEFVKNVDDCCKQTKEVDDDKT